jgi:hypothetical protein
MRYNVTIIVSVEAVSEDAAINIVEDAVNSYRSADIEVITSEAEEAL